MNSQTVFGYFLGIWILLMIGFAIFHMRASASTKRRWHPWLMIVSAVLFLGFASTLNADRNTWIFMLILVAAIVALNIKFTKFCSKCGRTHFGRLSTPKFCQHCGSSFEEKP